MEVVAATPNGNGVPPFHNHDVREWSRIDSLTGVLERARLETDHWTASTNNSSHKYGKVVDSRARSDADGALQQKARRQLEVFQSTIPGGRLQVIKSHTVSSSRWTSKTSTENDLQQHFGDLELSLNNPLDLSSQKSKATVGRSVGRRPPSRPRSRDETPASKNDPTANLTHRVSRLCHQIHESAVRQTFGKYLPQERPSIHERESGDGVEIVEIESASSDEKPSLTRTKSSSSEDLQEKSNKSAEDLEDLEQLQNWRRTSKIRRSLQFPQAKANTQVKLPLDLPGNTGSVRRIREDLETGRRLSTALRGNNVDLEALDQILQSISEPEKDEAKKQKRNSFVTVESLQEVRGRLRRTSGRKDEETDDGIGTEMPVSDGTQPSKVNSYIYGMEAMLKKPITGTGSLECRSSKQFNGNSNFRNEDWYNRRKSYGFEQVHHQEPASISKKEVMESSTDSGICRSNEIMLKNEDKEECNFGSVKRYASIFEQKDLGSTKITIPITSGEPGKWRGDTSKWSGDASKRNGDPNKWNGDSGKWNGDSSKWNEDPGKRNGDPSNRADFTKRSGDPSKWNDDPRKPDSKWKQDSKWNPDSTNWNGELCHPNWSCSNWDPSTKRHLISVDESAKFRASQDPQEDDPTFQGKKTKKVEFCKTEVHFAAESGRVNIVATDEKPPPTNNYRRRRRHSGTMYNQLLNDRNGLPVLHFGDSSYEKNLLGVNEQDDEDVGEVTNTVTVSTNQSFQVEEEPKDVQEEIPKGILKNKPIKPRPYLLGDDNFFSKQEDENGSAIWGVKLKPVETPMWRSTVTLKNTLYENGYQPESGVEDGIRVVDPRRSSWSVADRVRQVEDVTKTETKGYSTKINIGAGEATVIERHPTWPRNEDGLKAQQPEPDSSTKWEAQQRQAGVSSCRAPHSPVVLRKTYNEPKKQELKTAYNVEKLSSPFLVGQNSVIKNKSRKMEGYGSLNQNKDERNSKSYQPPSATKLKERRSPSPSRRNYSPSRAKRSPSPVKKLPTTFERKNYSPPRQPEPSPHSRRRQHDSPKFDQKLSSDYGSLRQSQTPKQTQASNYSPTRPQSSSYSPQLSNYSPTKQSQSFSYNATRQHQSSSPKPDSKRSHSPSLERKPSPRQPTPRKQHSPPTLERKSSTSESKTSNYNAAQGEPRLHHSPTRRIELRRQQSPTHSPSRQSQKETRQQTSKQRGSSEQKETKRQSFLGQKESTRLQSPLRQKGSVRQQSPLRQKESSNRDAFLEQEEKDSRRHTSLNQEEASKNPSLEQREPSSHHIPSNKTERQKSPNRSILRAPRKSEMAYFGVKTSPSPKPARKSSDKPDLLQHHETKESLSLRNGSARSESPIYENMEEIRKQQRPATKEFDSSILDELTKAADQILQAVNEDAHKMEEEKNKPSYRKEQLDTISETKSWKQTSKATSKPSTYTSKSRLKPTSSTSSVESTGEHSKLRCSTTESERHKKKTNGDSLRAATKARRLQRASSREALLQSHGSSSEDLPVTIEIPTRKPRMVRKTKTSQFTMSNGLLEVSKTSTSVSSSRKREEKGKGEERVPVGALPEIRHKTAVSTIRSTAEKTASRLHSKNRPEEIGRKKSSIRKDPSSSRTSLTSRSDRTKSITNKEPINHRISTANIKKCGKFEGTSRP